MAVRFWPDGAYEYLDPVGIGTTAGGGPVYDDGSSTPPWVPAPFFGANEIRVSRALELMVMPPEVIAAQPPPVPYVVFPPRFGYYTEPLTIEDVLDTDTWTPVRRSFVSGSLVRPSDEMYSGSARPAQSSGPPA